MILLDDANRQFNTHNTDNVRHITAAERTAWNSIENPTQQNFPFASGWSSVLSNFSRYARYRNGLIVFSIWGATNSALNANTTYQIGTFPVGFRTRLRFHSGAAIVTNTFDDNSLPCWYQIAESGEFTIRMGATGMLALLPSRVRVEGAFIGG